MATAVAAPLPSGTSSLPGQALVTILVDGPRGTIAFTAEKDAPLSTVYETLYERAPWIHSTTYILTTNSRRTLPVDATVSSLLKDASDTFVSLRLTVPLCGGKGGFGSILRAQGGRMSSRKKQGGIVNASARNLDGRRLRTVNEAKVLAEYLAIKPEMEKREKEERRQRWADIVASTERKQEELLNSRGQARLDGKWVEEKEEAENKTREAIERMMAQQASSSEEDDAEDLSVKPGASSKSAAQQVMFGWDEDDEFMSDSEEEEDEEDEEVDEEASEEVKVQYEGKGKAKVAA